MVSQVASDYRRPCVAPSPSPPEGRFQSPDVRRRQILDAAAHLAVAEGLDNASIAKVAAAAGLAKGSIYLHFASRQDLLAALQADLWDRMLRHPEAIVADDELSWAAKLDAVVEHLMRFAFDHHSLHHEVFHAVATGSLEPLERITELLDHLVASGTAAGEFHLGDLDRGVVLQFLLHAYLGPCFHQAEPATAVRDVQCLFRRALATTPPG